MLAKAWRSRVWQLRYVLAAVAVGLYITSWVIDIDEWTLNLFISDDVAALETADIQAERLFRTELITPATPDASIPSLNHLAAEEKIRVRLRHLFAKLSESHHCIRARAHLRHQTGRIGPSAFEPAQRPRQLI